MSGSAIDTLSKEDIALRDAMRDDGPEPEVTEQAPEPTTQDAAPEATQAPEETDAEVTETPERPRTVTVQALHSERERRRLAEAKAQAAEVKAAADAARFAERFQMLSDAVQAAATPPPQPAAPVEIPDINTDPIGHFQATNKALQKQIADLTAMQTGLTEQQRQAQQVAELRNWGAAQERAFTAQEPSYTAAMDFLTNSRRAELTAMGIVDPAAQTQIIQNDVTLIADMSRKQGANYAERLYKVAVGRGFTKEAAKPAAPPPLETEAAPDAVSRVQRGRDSATTIGNVGSAPPAALSPERIAAMSDREFAAHIEKIKANPTALHALMGA